MRPLEHQRIDFIWHGGEPLLAGQEFYHKALAVQQAFRRDGQMVRNSLQTNATLLSDEWCEFFKDHSFDIGVSIDGPQGIHDINRVFASGRGSFAEVVRGIELLRKHRIPFGLLMVLNHAAIEVGPQQIFRFFVDLGVKAFSFLPVRPDNTPSTGERPTNEYLSPQSYCDFMEEIFDLWYELDDPTVQVRELNSLVSAVVGGSASICTLTGQCLGQYFHIEPNGDAYHCDKYLGDSRYHVGNVMLHDFREIRSSQGMRRLIEEESRNLRTLRACPCFKFCHGGCPHDRYIARRRLPGYDGSCCGQRTLIEYIRGRVSSDLAEASNMAAGS